MAKPAMDWFSWLSKTTLDPSLVYSYSVAFTRNELLEEDLTYFDHELLQSMGISVAKHRIEILKLAKKETGLGPRKLSKFLLAIRRTKRRVAKGIGKWVFHDDMDATALPELRPYRAQWSGALSKKHTRLIMEANVNNGRLMMVPNRSPRASGPLDARIGGAERGMVTRSPKVSSPLDVRVRERSVVPMRGSPKVTGQLNRRFPSSKDCGLCDEDKLEEEEDGLDSIWAALFQDMNPT